MRQLLFINPKTSPAVTALLQQHVQLATGSHLCVRAVTARFGAPYITDEASYAIVAHAALDAWAAALTDTAAGRDAVLIGCFGDPGLMAFRESSPVPITGLAEAAFIEAARHGRFASVTGGERWAVGGGRWAPILQRLAQSLGHAQAPAGIHTATPTGAKLEADPAAARKLLAQACQDAVRQLGVQTVILGGAGLAHLFGDIWRRQPELLDPDIGAQIELGLAVSGPRMAELLRLREHFHASFTSFFEQYDALLCPVSPVEAWPLGSLGPSQIGGVAAGPRGHAAFTPIFNYGSVPAISLPCGTGRQGLPVGLQIAAPRFADALVLQLAWQAEQILGKSPASPLLYS